MKEPEFHEAVRTIRKFVHGASGDVSDRKLSAACLRVLPSLEDIALDLTVHNRSAGQIRRHAALVNPKAPA